MIKVTADFCPVCHTHFVGNHSGKVHKACLVLGVWINAKNTIGDALQAIRNKQKNFFCTTFFQVKKQLFPMKNDSCLGIPRQICDFWNFGSGTNQIF